ncbi:MAG: hypothetical protein AAFO03_00830 [Bacteroidota bacterium]
MAGQKGRSGGKRPGAGRKPKKLSDAVQRCLNPYEEGAAEALGAAIEHGEAWAVKMFFAYRYGKPVQCTENKHEITEKAFENLPTWMDD